MLKFNDFGNLVPNTIIEIDLTTVEQTLAFNAARTSIFAQFKSLLRAVFDVANGKIPFIWIDGSYATLKPKPGDMDIVIFMDFQEYEKNVGFYKQVKKENKGVIDCHFVSVFPEKHPSRSWYESDRIEFLHLFLTDRKKRQKGILQINF